ncbi:LacI family DNA-binding transcriptional regulator [Deinococcus roseus]|uniref:LacI family transcriptional regulator n=1 Tax=Deinococcus roseus TaxID=392414 RepID=A0ABQ2CZ75_9DEIO|nr:LacI family DNA-binding transcriptional regulator [Deinococcus roseus]GGJ31698.1 LacI family transcriptional regulator [Deinococcus roseus]
MSRPTIYDVAQKAGVSVATVSNVINTPAKVKPATLQKVMKAIDDLKFVPKLEAVTYSRKGYGSIGVVATFTAYASFNMRLAGVLDALRNQPYKVVVYDQTSPQREGDYLAKLPITGHLDGVIVMSLPLGDQVVRRLQDRKLETVLVECDAQDFSSVEIDNVKGGRLAAEHLLSRGYKRPAFLGEQQFAHSTVVLSGGRLTGFKKALEDAGIGLPDRYISLGTYGVEEAQKQATELLSLKDPPDAIFAYSDLQAAGVLKAARALNLKVPDDIAVIGFDDMDFADFLGLTTVHQPLIESGKVAARLLLDRLANPSASAQQVILPVRVIQRQTT